MEVVKQHFRPEFINRLDEIILFNRLSQENMAGIVQVQFERLKKRLLVKNIKADLDEKGLKYLAEKGYDPVYGARPLKRVIQREIENILAEKILKGDVKDGDEIKISADKNGVLIG